MAKKWYKGTVLQGDKIGRTINIPTVNLSADILPSELKEGIYACIVKIKDKNYLGTLFWGPRLVKGETNRVLEIYIHNFDRQIYGKEITFIIYEFIREVKHFNTFEELRLEIEKDIKMTEKILS